MAALTLSGKQVHTNGELPPVGSVAPEFFLTNKALEVIDEDGRVIHSQLVSEIADEPDYVAALQALN